MKARVIQEEMIETQIISLACGPAALFTAKHPTEARENQDAALVMNYGSDTSLLAVADGVGGARGGEQASLLALENIRNAVEHAEKEKGHLREAVLDGFEKANLAAQNIGAGAGSTLLVVTIQGNQIQSYNVGDSQCLVVGQQGKLKFETTPHSVTGYAQEAGLIEPKEAMEHEERHVILNALGSKEMHIEIGPLLTLDPKDRVLLGTDGVFDNLTVEEIGEIVRSGPLKESAESLVQKSHHRMKGNTPSKPSKPDDLTFILFDQGREELNSAR